MRACESTVLLALLASACSSQVAQHPPLAMPGAVVVFEGMCDASGAVPLDGRRFAVADDEDNLLRIYDADRGGAPLAIVDIGAVELDAGEMDLEAATRVDDSALWLASHSRTKAGEPAPARLKLFATTAPDEDAKLQLVGRPFEGLLPAMIAEPRLRAFDLERAAKRAPDAHDGLNIEGMTARPDGGVVIGFRNPVPDGKGLIIGVTNPLDVAERAAQPEFDDVHLIDFGDDRGIRGISYWRGRYLVIGGSPTHTVPSELNTWDGKSDRVDRVDVDLSTFNPEAFYSPEDREHVLILSDDGEVPTEGTICKHHPDPAKKRFRGIWLDLSAHYRATGALD